MGQEVSVVKNTGVARKLDDLGRIVLPAELRRALDLKAGDELDIALDGDHIVLAKVQSGCALCGSEVDLLAFRDRYVCRSCVGALADERAAVGTSIAL